jgi:hypothetical protein
MHAGRVRYHAEERANPPARRRNLKLLGNTNSTKGRLKREAVERAKLEAEQRRQEELARAEAARAEAARRTALTPEERLAEDMAKRVREQRGRREALAKHLEEMETQVGGQDDLSVLVRSSLVWLRELLAAPVEAAQLVSGEQRDKLFELARLQRQGVDIVLKTQVSVDANKLREQQGGGLSGLLDRIRSEQALGSAM